MGARDIKCPKCGTRVQGIVCTELNKFNNCSGPWSIKNPVHLHGNCHKCKEELRESSTDKLGLSRMPSFSQRCKN